nr:MAG TPA: hypothetical protein [Caudoviricetes sp.]
MLRILYTITKNRRYSLCVFLREWVLTNTQIAYIIENRKYAFCVSEER